VDEIASTAIGSFILGLSIPAAQIEALSGGTEQSDVASRGSSTANRALWRGYAFTWGVRTGPAVCVPFLSANWAANAIPKATKNIVPVATKRSLAASQFASG
jgi:hypothetical protein